ncbi:unnamed protein product [Brassicogethes aeneus]|uniref:Vps16 C-terminal domain-containing protein n=1 Tax=Brassicogethes aeneus TaxID=1431903 RepID=A0A9P0B2N0_BRAAE|nr:unnamed protein product [Brassicogethes aeneus]
MDVAKEDDFWNISSSSGFNFDDEEDNSHVQESIFSSSTEENLTLPIHSIISKVGLDLVLDDVKSTNQRVVAPVEETIKKMSYSQKYYLPQYQQFDEKMLLLDLAIETLDGNVIIKIVLFLKATLRQNIFYHQVAKRKLAVRHYANYLISTSGFQELADMYMATGNSYNMIEIYYLIGKNITNKETVFKKLEQFMMEHLQKVGNDEKSELYDQMDFLRWQIENKQQSESVIEQLAVLCKIEWTKNKNNNEKVMAFKKLLRIDDFIFEWTILNVLASMELWPQINNLFIKPNWLTKKHTFKSIINPELFVYCIGKHNPSKDILEQYLNFISDSETSLHLGKKLNCHKFVIQHFINQKDRNSLVNYRSKIPPQIEEYFLIEQALKNLVN